MVEEVQIVVAFQEEAAVEAVLGADTEVVLRDMEVSVVLVAMAVVKEGTLLAVRGPHMAAAVHLEVAAAVALQEEARALLLRKPVAMIAR